MTDMPSDVPDIRQQAEVSGDGRVYQAGGNQFIETHLYFGSGVERTRRVESVPAAEVCPYPTGMAAFRPQDAEWFFGRDRLLAGLIERLDQRLRQGGGPLVVVAPSGAGKSSLLQAGLAPKLEQGALPGSQQWPGLRMTPTEHPVTALAAALAAVAGKPTEEVTGQLTDQPSQGIEVLRTALQARADDATGADVRLVLIVDQLEELFTVCTDEHERRRFLDLLARLSTSDPGGQDPVALVLYGLRADFYAHCADYPQLRSALQEGQVLVGPMSSAELRQVIVYPAEHAGLRVEPGLVELLLHDLGVPTDADGGYEAGRLPLLAHALRTTWIQRHGHTLTVDGYRLTGGIQRAVANTAEGVFMKLNPEQQHAARALFFRLVKIGDANEDTRRRTSRTNLLDDSSDPQTMRTVLDLFTQDRLLTQSRDVVEITHEALLRAWPRLHDWINEDRAGSLVRQQLNEAATAWADEGRDAGALYRGTRLESAREQARSRPGQDELSSVAREFLDTSTRHECRDARRRRQLLTTLSVVTVLALIASVIAIIKAQDASRNGGIAVTQRNNVAAESLARQSVADQGNADPTNARLTGLAAHAIAPSIPMAQHALENAAADRLVSSTPTKDYWITTIAMNHDGNKVTFTGFGTQGEGRPATGTEDVPAGRITIHPSATPPPGKAAQPPNTTADSGDHTRRAIRQPDGAVRVIDIATGAVVRSIAPFGDGASAVAMSFDGRITAVVKNPPSSSWDRGGSRVELVDTATGFVLDTFTDPHPGGITCAAFSEDSSRFTAGTSAPSGGGGGDGGHMDVWDLMPDRVTTSGAATDWNGWDHVWYGPRGRFGVAAWDRPQSRDNTAPNVQAVLRRSSDGATVDINLHGHPVQDVAYSTGGSQLAVLSGDSIQIWDLSRPLTTTPGQTISLPSENFSAFAIAFSDDGRTVGVGATRPGAGPYGDSLVQFWNLQAASPEPIGPAITGANRGYVYSIALSTDGRRAIASTRRGAGDRATVLFIDVAHNKTIGSAVDLPSDSQPVTISPSGLLAAWADPRGVHIWDIPRGTEDTSHPLFVGAEVTALRFSDDGQTLATNDSGGHVQLWDTRTQLRIGAPVNVPGNTRDETDVPLTFTDGGTYLIAVTDSGTIATVDVSFLNDARAIVCRQAGVQLSTTWWSANVPEISADTATNVCAR